MRPIALMMIPGVFTLYAAGFEVASVKRTPPDEEGLTLTSIMECSECGMSLCGAASQLLEVPEAQIIGGPRWITELRFDIDAMPLISAL
jgi:uncharacterized protein (TIGR03435 family)